MKGASTRGGFCTAAAVRAVAAIPAVGLIAGAASGLALPPISSPLAAALLVTCFCAAACAWHRSRSFAFGLAIASGFFVGGAMLSADASRQALRPSLRAAFEDLARRERQHAAVEGRRLPFDGEAFATVTGVLRSDAAVASGSVLLSISVDTINDHVVDGGVQASVVGSLAAGQVEMWRAGRRVRMPIQLRRPSRYLDPDVPDFERALGWRGVTLVGTVKSGALVELVAPAEPIDECIAQLRAFIRRAVSRAVSGWSERSAAIVSAIVIGDRAGLDDEVQRRLQDAGTYHVIAISGGNIAILAGLLLAAFRCGGVLGPFAMIAASVVLVSYARLVGGGASVQRATLMAVLYFVARALDQRSPAANTLAVVAAAVVTAQPLAVADPAFVLTFGATLAIVLVTTAVRSWTLSRLLFPIVGMLAASLATETVLLPVGAMLFSRVTFAGLVLNFAAVPLMTVAQVAGMAIVPVAIISDRAALAIGFVAHLAAAGLVRSADLVQIAPLLCSRVAPPHWSAVIVYYVAVAAAWRRRDRLTATTVAVLAGIWILAEPWTLLVGRGDGRLHVTFADVGQGDSAFVRFPSGTTMLVDAGGIGGMSTFDIGDRVVAPILRAAGVRRLDYMVLTHGDPDHIGGAPAIVGEFRPRHVWEGIPVPPFEPLHVLRTAAQAVAATWSNVRTNDRTAIDGVDVIVRHPDVPDWERQRVRNDDSIVLELRWRDISVVLTGDIGRNVERTLKGRMPAAAIRIVKVPHHGSLTSSTPEFLAALAPKIAVVSAGRANHFGHPVPEVIRRYQDVGAKVFRTDEDGAVTVDTDGHSVDVRTFTGRTLSLR
ncbi:MAG: DNA internalization-related competence protein ComEC/Rec2 [Blastocatellia bacterium]|nr:MAG: DNA internalization-related competence protein ComEC/Rec2 [Blastocatellia bacterium]